MTAPNTNAKGASKLPKMVKADIRQWLEEFVISGKKLYHNELDLQVDLAIYLRGLTGRYDDVQTEYFIDKKIAAKKNPDFKKRNVWNTDMSLDIVLRRGNEWFVIEMKYKTRALTKDEKKVLGKSFENRFGDPCDFNLKTHAASNLGMYDFWKDVCRIEIVKHLFSNAVGGIVLFITNEKRYWEGPGKDTDCEKFSMNEESKRELRQDNMSDNMSWKDGSRNCAKNSKRKNFTIEHTYNGELKWNSGKGVPTDSIFQYLMLQV